MNERAQSTHRIAQQLEKRSAEQSQLHLAHREGLALEDVVALRALAADLRKSAFELILAAKSGHLGASSSSAELLSTLYFGGILRFDREDPRHPERDRVLIRGHVGPLRYSLFSKIGWVAPEELRGYRTLGSRLHGHERMEDVPGVDITPSGSLGMLLSYGTGAALSARETKKDFVTFVFLGDGEEQEGNVSEAARHAAHLKLDNLVCIVDENGAQLGKSTRAVDGASKLSEIWSGYGWRVIEIPDGHDIAALHEGLLASREPDEQGRPTLVIARTIKGNGIPGAEEHVCGYHTISSCNAELVQEGIAAAEREISRLQHNPESLKAFVRSRLINATLPPSSTLPRLGKGFPDLDCASASDLLEAQILFFHELREMLVRDELTAARVYVLSADLFRTDELEQFGFHEPVKYRDVGIREQHLFAMAHGLAVTDPEALIIIHSSEAFAYRAADQLNALAQGGSHVIVIGDDAGVSGGKNGATHQTSGQPGMVQSMPNVAFLEPADPADFLRVMRQALTTKGQPVYVRLHTAPTRALGVPEDLPAHAASYIAHEPTGDPDIVLVASGLPVFGSLDASTILAKSGVFVRVVNVINSKQLGEDFVQQLAPGKPVLCIYNGAPQILTHSVSAAVMASESPRPARIAGFGFEQGTTGSLPDLIRHFGFDGAGIAEHAKLLLPELPPETISCHVQQEPLSPETEERLPVVHKSKARAFGYALRDILGKQDVLPVERAARVLMLVQNASVSELPPINLAQVFQALGNLSLRDAAVRRYVGETGRAAMSHLCECLAQHGRAFGARHAGEVISGLASLRYGEHPALDSLLNHVAGRVDSYSPQEVNALVHSVWRLEVVHEGFTRALSRYYAKRVDHADPAHLAYAVGLLVRSGAHAEACAVLEALAPRLTSMPEAILGKVARSWVQVQSSSSSVSKLLCDAFVERMKQEPLTLAIRDATSLLHALAEHEYRDAAALRLFSSSFSNRIRELPLAGVREVAWSYAVLREKDLGIFKAVAEVAAVADVEDPHDLSVISWACASVGLLNPQLMRSVAERFEGRWSGLSPSTLANLAWGFCRSDTTIGRRIVYGAIEAMREKTPTIEQLLQLRMAEVASGLANGSECPEVILRAAEKAARASKMNRFESLVFEKLKQLDNGTLDIQAFYVVEGIITDFRIDVGERKILLECDGVKHHFTANGARKGSDLIQDRVFQRRGFEVAHITDREWFQSTEDEQLRLLKERLKLSAANGDV